MVSTIDRKKYLSFNSTNLILIKTDFVPVAKTVVKEPLVDTELALAVTPVSAWCELIALAMAIALAAAELVKEVVLLCRSSAATVARIATPLITKSPSPNALMLPALVTSGRMPVLMTAWLLV